MYLILSDSKTTSPKLKPFSQPAVAGGVKSQDVFACDCSPCDLAGGCGQEGGNGIAAVDHVPDFL